MSLDFSLTTKDLDGNALLAYSGNITHNLNKMAEEAGLYSVLWEPNEHGFVTAKQIIPVLELGLEKLKSSPDYFKSFDSPNGWGLYIHFVPFVGEILEACKKHPSAAISANR